MAKTVQLKGVCFCCGRLICLDSSLAVCRHGHTKMDNFSYSGSCAGSNFPHYGCQSWLASAKTQIKVIRRNISSIKNLSFVDEETTKLREKSVKEQLRFIEFIKTKIDKWEKIPPIEVRTKEVAQGKAVEAEKARIAKEIEQEKIKNAREEREANRIKKNEEKRALALANNYYSLYVSHELVETWSASYDDLFSLTDAIYNRRLEEVDKLEAKGLDRFTANNLVEIIVRTKPNGKGRKIDVWSIDKNDEDYQVLVARKQLNDKKRSN